MPEVDAIENLKPVETVKPPIPPRWPNPPAETDDKPSLPVRAFVMPKRPAFPRILDGQLPASEFARNVWIAKPEPHVTKNDMLRPVFWSHVAKKLRVGDRIEALSSDTTWFAELIVRAVAGLEVIVGELRHIQFDSIGTRNAADYEVKWVSPTIGFRVTRLDDKAVVKEGLKSKEAVAAWMAEPLADKAA